MDRLNNNESDSLETVNEKPNELTEESMTSNDTDLKSENSRKMEEKRAEREEADKKSDDLLLAIDGAKIKFNAHLGEFKVLSDVPTTQGKLTGTVVEKQVANFRFYDGFKMLSLTEWQDFGTALVQDHYVLLKKSKLPGVGKMPGNIPPETGNIEFVDSGQINEPESIETLGAPVPKQEEDEKKCFCNRDFTVEEMNAIVIALRKGEITGYYSKKIKKIINNKEVTVIEKVSTSVYDSAKTKDYLFANQSDIKRVEKLSVDESSYKSVTAMLNKVMNNYNINTCIRKIHFISQAYHESHRFRATFEGRTEKNTPSNYKGGYNFQGRGFMQLTHNYNYIKYYNYLYKTQYELKNKKFYDETLIPFTKLIAINLEYAFDSAGWYWKNIDNVNAIGIDMNLAADSDNTLYVSQGINGRVKNPNGLKERKKYVEDLKKIMKYENCINKKN